LLVVDFSAVPSRPSWICLFKQVEAFVYRGEPELAVEQDDVVGIETAVTGITLRRFLIRTSHRVP
jgi:hypothetical protein